MHNCTAVPVVDEASIANKQHSPDSEFKNQVLCIAVVRSIEALINIKYLDVLHSLVYHSLSKKSIHSQVVLTSTCRIVVSTASNNGVKLKIKVHIPFMTFLTYIILLQPYLLTF